MDSISATCRQNPLYCTPAAGDEAIVPLSVRAAQVGAAGKTWQALDEVARKGLEKILWECVRWADATVNERELGGRQPTADDCGEVVGGDKKNPVTRAMALGKAKHELALQCTAEKLGKLRPGGFSIEQRYRYNYDKDLWEPMSAARVQELLQIGLKAELSGTLVPDLVIHSGNPAKVELVYDYKFPCPETNSVQWRPYPQNHPFNGSTQQGMYHDAFGVTPYAVSPLRGVSR